jgi:hypothetical protein
VFFIHVNVSVSHFKIRFGVRCGCFVFFIHFRKESLIHILEFTRHFILKYTVENDPLAQIHSGVP